jgi:hypothetical protein
MNNKRTARDSATDPFLSSHCARAITSRRRGVAVDAVLKKCERAQQARRKKSVLHRRVWRRYMREPFWDLKTSLFVHRTGMRDTICNKFLKL